MSENDSRFLLWAGAVAAVVFVGLLIYTASLHGSLPLGSTKPPAAPSATLADNKQHRHSLAGAEQTAEGANPESG